MNRKLSSFAIACGLVLTGTHVSAATITFEDLAEGATLSNQYAALGVLFSPNAFSGANINSTAEPWATNTGMTITSTDVGALGTPLLVSGKLLHSFQNYLDEDGDASILATFTTPINSISMDFAGIFTPGDVTMVIYNGASIIGTVVAPACTPTCQTTLSFAAPSITKVAFTPGSFNDWVGVDNIKFTQATVVPEASTYAMMALGLGLVLGSSAFKRRRG
jgi:PEP-CTERM motif